MHWIVLAIVLAYPAHALYKTRDVIQNYCWKDKDALTHCIKDDENKVRILLYSATWCLPCQKKAQQLAKATDHLAGKDVVFYTLLCDTQEPSKLKKWEDDNGFAKAKARLLTLSSFRDCGRDFADEQMVPSAAVIDKQSRLRSWNVNPSLLSLTRQAEGLLRELLNK